MVIIPKKAIMKDISMLMILGIIYMAWVFSGYLGGFVLFLISKYEFEWFPVWILLAACLFLGPLLPLAWWYEEKKSS